MVKKSLRHLARKVVQEAVKKDGKELLTFMHQVTQLLADEGLLPRWREFERELHAAWKEAYGASKITVMSAHELTAAARAHLETTAKGAELSVLTNPRLLGGAVIRADERRIDGSVLGALTRLKQTLLA